jgi:hypothetical protein
MANFVQIYRVYRGNVIVVQGSTLDPGRHLASLELSRLLSLDTTRVSCDDTSWELELALPLRVNTWLEFNIPLLKAGLSNGSWTIKAFDTAKAIASAWPVVPPPLATHQTLYLSMRSVTLRAQRALSRS